MKKLLAILLACSLALTSVSFAGPSGPPQSLPVSTEVQTPVTVTNSSTEIAAADTFGRNVFIQNNDASGIVYLNLSGAAVANGTMITLEPDGGAITMLNVTNAIEAIGSIASNANVVLVEN